MPPGAGARIPRLDMDHGALITAAPGSGDSSMQTQSDTDSTLHAVVAATRAACKLPLPEVISRGHCFITDLGFDSLSIARLALELEDRVQQPVLLDDWIASEPDPSALTVGSLCDYVAALG